MPGQVGHRDQALQAAKVKSFCSPNLHQDEFSSLDLDASFPLFH